MAFIRAMVHIFSPHENICTIALITIHYLYTTQCQEQRGNCDNLLHWRVTSGSRLIANNQIIPYKT